MSLTLEPYNARLYVAAQGKQLHALVDKAKPWLEAVTPGTVERYRDIPHAIANVRRITTAEGMQAFIIKEHRVALGIATLIFDQTIIHPEACEVQGTDVGYWVAEDVDDALHRRIARDLMLKNEYVMDMREENVAVEQHQYSLVAAIPTALNTDHRPRGLEATMQPFGEPGSLQVPDGVDTFGVTFGGQEAQLLVRSYTKTA